MTDAELTQLFTGYGYKPYFVEGHEPEIMHQLMAATLDTVLGEIHAIQKERARRQVARRSALADDHYAHAQGLDRTEGRGRKARRRHLARPSSAGNGLRHAS